MQFSPLGYLISFILCLMTIFGHWTLRWLLPVDNHSWLSLVLLFIYFFKECGRDQAWCWHCLLTSQHIGVRAQRNQEFQFIFDYVEFKTILGYVRSYLERERERETKRSKHGKGVEASRPSPSPIPLKQFCKVELSKKKESSEPAFSHSTQHHRD